MYLIVWWECYAIHVLPDLWNCHSCHQWTGLWLLAVLIKCCTSNTNTLCSVVSNPEYEKHCSCYCSAFCNNFLKYIIAIRTYTTEFINHRSVFSTNLQYWCLTADAIIWYYYYHLARQRNTISKAQSKPSKSWQNVLLCGSLSRKSVGIKYWYWKYCNKCSSNKKTSH